MGHDITDLDKLLLKRHKPGHTQVDYKQTDAERTADAQQPAGCVFCPTGFPKTWLKFKSIRSPKKLLLILR